MSNALMLVFTGVIAGSTIIYTYFSIKLWRATRASVDVARFTAFMELLYRLYEELEKERAEEKPTVAMHEQFIRTIGEFGFEIFIKDLDIKKTPELVQYLSTFDGLFRAWNINPDSIAWFRALKKKMKL